MKNCYLHFTLLLTTLLLVACGGAQADASAGPVVIRDVHPTFTPTFPAPGQNAAQSQPVVNSPASTPVADVAQPAAAVPLAQSAPAAAAPAGNSVNGITRVVVNTPLVNGRAGPGVDYPIVEIVERGQEFDVIGASESGEWWNVCCINDKPFWLINEYVDTIGDGTVAVVPAPAQAAPTAAPTAVPPTVEPTATVNQPPAVLPTATSAPEVSAPAAPATDNFTFDLKLQEQFPENNVVRVFLYVFSKEGQALEGYGLRVAKDGTQLPADGLSFGPQAGFTWPVAEARQRFQNLKVEFPGQSPAGVWEVQLIDSSGTAVGPAATFELNGNEQNRELYVRYEKR
ncbi:MAG: hypothetical protein R3A44_12575 [Caldilineaceae bacterium]